MNKITTDIIVRNISDRARVAVVRDVIVDADAGATWIARSTLEQIGIETRTGKERTFIRKDGIQIMRSVGYVVLNADPNYETTDEVVFAEAGERQLIGARTLSGFGAQLDRIAGQMRSAGPILAARNFGFYN